MQVVWAVFLVITGSSWGRAYDPCDAEKFNLYPRATIEKEIQKYQDSDKSPLLTEQEYRELVDPKKETKALPEVAVLLEIQAAFEQLVSCKELKGTPIKLMMGDEPRGPNLYSDTSKNRIIFGRKMGSRIRNLKLSNDDNHALLQFLIAHEFAHYIVESYVKGDATQRTAGGNRSGIAIMKDEKTAKTKAENALLEVEYTAMHDEVDAVASVLLRSCGLAIPRLNVLIQGMGGDPSQLAYCSSQRKRALSIIKNASQK